MSTLALILAPPAREAFMAAYADRPAPDLVVGHEPWAVEGVNGGVLVNGHMHSTDLEGCSSVGIRPSRSRPSSTSAGTP